MGRTVDIDKERYELLFGFENLCVLMRKSKSNKSNNTSIDFDIIHIFDMKVYKPFDCLSDVMISHSIGKIVLVLGDIVCIRFNGCLTAYRYIGGESSYDVSLSYRAFELVSDFCSREIEQFIYSIHENRCILDVLNKKMFPLSQLLNSSYKFYAIGRENYIRKNIDSSGYIASDYTVYHLNGQNIESIDISGNAITSITSALFYFKKFCSKDKIKSYIPILLFSRRELELVRDYCYISLLT